MLWPLLWSWNVNQVKKKKTTSVQFQPFLELQSKCAKQHNHVYNELISVPNQAQLCSARQLSEFGELGKLSLSCLAQWACHGMQARLGELGLLNSAHELGSWARVMSTTRRPRLGELGMASLARWARFGELGSVSSAQQARLTKVSLAWQTHFDELVSARRTWLGSVSKARRPRLGNLGSTSFAWLGELGSASLASLAQLVSTSLVRFGRSRWAKLSQAHIAELS